MFLLLLECECVPLLRAVLPWAVVVLGCVLFFGWRGWMGCGHSGVAVSLVQHSHLALRTPPPVVVAPTGLLQGLYDGYTMVAPANQTLQFNDILFL